MSNYAEAACDICQPAQFGGRTRSIAAVVTRPAGRPEAGVAIRQLKKMETDDFLFHGEVIGRVTAAALREKVSKVNGAALTVITVLKGRAHDVACVRLRMYERIRDSRVASEHNLTRYIGVVLTCLA